MRPPALIANLSPKTRRVPFKQYGCRLHKKHRPMPSRSELHHRFPLYLQKRVWADVDPTNPATAHDTERIPVCEGGHTDVHVTINALILGGPIPKGVGRAERAEAREAVRRFMKAGGTIEIGHAGPVPLGPDPTSIDVPIREP